MSRSTGVAGWATEARAPAAPSVSSPSSSAYEESTLFFSLVPLAVRQPSVRDDAGGGEGRAGSVHLQVPGGAGPAHVRQQVGVAAHLVHVHTVFLPVRQAAPDESLQGAKEQPDQNLLPSPRSFCANLTGLRFAANLGFVTGDRLDGKLDVGGFQYRVFLQDVLLGLVVAEGLWEEESFRN